MRHILRKIWQLWLKLGLLLGNIVSAVILFIFYFTIFGLFALPLSFRRKFLKPASSNSNWRIKQKQYFSLKDFENEF